MTAAYEQEIAEWRARAEADLRADDGWLTVVGLFWLKQGRNTVGSDAECDVVLPAGPALLGWIELEDESATLRAAGDGVVVNGELAAAHELRPDVPGPPDFVTVGDVTFFLLRRAGRLGVRVRDKNSAARRAFEGRRWFPVREEYRVEARFTAYEPPRPVAIANILGDTEAMTAAGYASFVLGGRELRLEALSRSDGQLFFIFRDGTSGHETYPAARFLVTPRPAGEALTLDFNKAYNPPCAFTDYATCPLPPPGNHLPVRIEAGELMPRSHGANHAG
ncbi:MAG: DUF1684 domain-containing protein [Chloroflexota bacterium]